MIEFEVLLSEPEDRVVMLSLAGEVDMATVAPVQEAVATVVESGSCSTLVFDLTSLTFMDSTGLQAMVEARNKMAALGGTTEVRHAAPNVRKIFEITGLDRLFEMVGEPAGTTYYAAA